MNLTLSADAELIKKARQVAHRHGTTLNDLVRNYLCVLVGEESAAATAKEFVELVRNHGGHSGGYQFRREDAYKDRL